MARQVHSLHPASRPDETGIWLAIWCERLQLARRTGRRKGRNHHLPIGLPMARDADENAHHEAVAASRSRTLIDLRARVLIGRGAGPGRWARPIGRHEVRVPITSAGPGRLRVGQVMGRTSSAPAISRAPRRRQLNSFHTPTTDAR